MPQHQELADHNCFLQYKYYCKDKYQKDPMKFGGKRFGETSKNKGEGQKPLGK